jgi:Caspase domain/Glucodextranase, domain B
MVVLLRQVCLIRLEDHQRRDDNMKKLITFMFLLIPVAGFAQYSGATQPGALFQSPQQTSQQNFDLPQIVLLQPELNGNELLYQGKSLFIKGYVQDKYTIESLMINGENVKLTSNNNFETKVKLSKTSTLVNIVAQNNQGKQGILTFTVLNQVDKSGPTIYITNPVVERGIKIVRKSDVVTVKGYATDVSGILNISVNDQKPSLGKNGQFVIDLYLNVGDNKITVKATDNQLNTTVDTFIVTRKLEDIIKGGKYIALVIGIDSYNGYWPQLRNAANDAEGVAEALKRYYTFDKVYTLIDQQATRKNILDKFDWLSKNLTPDDNLLIFYSGHGQFNKILNKGFWVPVDATSNSVADYISNDDIKTFIGGIPSKHTLLITDACFAGDIFRGAPTEESAPFDPNNMERYYKEVYSKQSRDALTSGGLEEVMDNGKDHHSIFTYYLLKTLKDNQQKYMDATQLYNDFKVAVANNSDQTPILQALRDTDDEGGQFIFVRKDK